MIENYTHEDLIRVRGRSMELDVYLPTERLAFEYQGQQHYFDVYTLGNLWIQKELDKEKRLACEKNGITLIEIPFWWDFKKPSLVATIYSYNPHLVSSKGEGEPIPEDPPKQFPEGELRIPK